MERRASNVGGLLYPNILLASVHQTENATLKAQIEKMKAEHQQSEDILKSNLQQVCANTHTHTCIGLLPTPPPFLPPTPFPPSSSLAHCYMHHTSPQCDRVSVTNSDTRAE